MVYNYYLLWLKAEIIISLFLMFHTENVLQNTVFLRIFVTGKSEDKYLLSKLIQFISNHCTHSLFCLKEIKYPKK